MLNVFLPTGNLIIDYQLGRTLTNPNGMLYCCITLD
jgi:hypothetical protein